MSTHEKDLGELVATVVAVAIFLAGYYAGRAHGAHLAKPLPTPAAAEASGEHRADSSTARSAVLPARRGITPHLPTGSHEGTAPARSADVGAGREHNFRGGSAGLASALLSNSARRTPNPPRSAGFNLRNQS